jgi:integrase
VPSRVVARGDRYGARMMRKVRGRRVEEWLGTFDTAAEAEAAVERARARKRPPRRERPPTLEQVAALEAAARSRDRDDVADFLLASAWTGLRLFEVAASEAEHVREQGTRLWVPNGKGGKERTVAVLPGARTVLQMRAERWPRGPLFRNQAGRPFSRQAINRVWSGEEGRPGVRDAAGMPRAVFHDLRRFHATWLLDHGVGDIDVAIQLGHFDALGRPDADLVRRVYGFPSHREALARIDQTGGSR